MMPSGPEAAFAKRVVPVWLLAPVQPSGLKKISKQVPFNGKTNGSQKFGDGHGTHRSHPGLDRHPAKLPAGSLLALDP